MLVVADEPLYTNTGSIEGAGKKETSNTVEVEVAPKSEPKFTIEKEQQLEGAGGFVKTLQLENRRFELGPNGFLDSKPETRRLQTFHYRHDNLVVVVRPDHPLADRDRGRPHHVHDRRFQVAEAGHAISSPAINLDASRYDPVALVDKVIGVPLSYNLTSLGV